MADAVDAAAATPKKKNRPAKKKKNYADKNVNVNTPKPNANPSEAVSENRSKSETGDGSGQATPQDKSNNATPERKYPTPRPQQQQRKKNNSSVRKAKVQNKNAPHIPPPSQEDGEDKFSREEKRHQMELQRHKIEEERRKRWYHYFLSKPSDLLRLDRNHIILLKYVEKLRQHAQFVCALCNYYCDNMSVVATHIYKTSHIKELQRENEVITLAELPDLTRDQLAVLNTALHKVVDSYGLAPCHLETRRTICVLVSNLVTSNLPGCSIRLFGSSIHGLGLKSSDVNMDLQVPEGSSPPAMLKEVANMIRKCPHFENVLEKFDHEFPFVAFTYKKSKEVCSISLNNERAVNLAVLLSKYTPLDPRLAQLATLFRLWGQLTETDKPQRGTWPGYAFYLMTIFYLQRCPEPVLPVLNDLLAESEESESVNTIKVLSMDVSEIRQKWKTSNTQNLAELWRGLLMFYARDFNYNEFIICIDSEPIPRKTRKIFIVDPFLPTRNVARTVTSNSIFYYIMSCLMTSCRYFSIPQTKYGAIFKYIYTKADSYHPDHENLMFIHNRINSQLIQLIIKLDSFFVQNRVGVQEAIQEVMQLMSMHNYVNVDNIPWAYLERTCVPPRQAYKDMCVSASDAELMISSLSPRALEYHFTTMNLTGGTKLPLVCPVCKREGHFDDCPEERLPPLEPLPERTPKALQVMDDLCNHIFEKWKQSDADINMRKKICEELQEFIGAAHPSVKLELFGSTKNGFGLKGSDMDICLTFNDNKNGEGLDTRAFIEVLYKLLKGFRGVQDLLPIATAKVPIVKFTHRATRLDGDISLYNVLALENSKLLCTYAQIDVRARIVGCMMKRFSKVCRIGDASKGSLSSYAYTLLVIYYLQQCRPPVLPVLQELTEDGGPPPKHIVEGCNAYFFKDLTKLDQVWPGRGRNTLSAGELWLDLLIFYTENFDLLNHVVCIRSSRPVTKFEKLWISRGIAIEDPFDLSHNLGSALTRKMSLYIIKALRKGRNHFGRSVTSATVAKDIEAFYLNARDLTDGEPPNDRGCRFCKSIGHKERDCPEKKKRGKGKQKKKKEDTATPKKEVSVRKPVLKNASDDDENEDDESYSDGSSDQEEENLRETRKRPEKQNIKKAEASPIGKKAPVAEVGSSRAGGSNASHHLPKPSPPEVDRRSFQTIPPGFIVQDTHRPTGPQFGPFVVSSSPTTSQTRPLPPTNSNQPRDLPFTPQTLTNNDKQMHIPTIVFSNSKLATDNLRSPVNPVVRFPFVPGQEPARPPPGFVPLTKNGQQFPNSFSPDKKQTRQNSWNFEGQFFAATSMTNPNMELMRNIPMYASPAPISSIATSGTSPRPPVVPSFNNLRFTGMLGPTEQMIWGHSPPPPITPTQLPAFRPTMVENAAMHNVNAAIGKIQLNNPTTPLGMDVAREELKNIRKEFPEKESEVSPSQNKIVQQSFPPNSKNILNNST